MPAGYKILKSQSNASADFTDATADIGYATNKTLTLKISQFSIDIQTPTVDGTPEKKSAISVYQERFHTGRVEGTAAFKGYIIAGELIGINSLPLETVDVKVALGKNFANDQVHRLAFRLAVERTKIDWARTAVGVPVMIEGRITDTFNAGGGTSVAETIS